MPKAALSNVAAASAVEVAPAGVPLKRIRLLPLGDVILRDGRGPFSMPLQVAHAVVASSGLLERTHFVGTFPAVQKRYLRVVLYWPGPADMQPFSAGVLCVGRRLQPGADGSELSGFDWGAGRRVEDQSTVRVLPGGGRAIWKGAKVPEVRGTFSHLTDAELAQFWVMQMAVGESDPLLLVEAPDTLGDAGAHDRIHYGTLVGLDFFERRQANKSRVEVRLQHWL